MVCGCLLGGDEVVSVVVNNSGVTATIGIDIGIGIERER